VVAVGFKVADKNFADKGVKLVTLSHFNALIDQAIAQNYISADSLESLKKWRLNPEKWGV
jgi:orotate phosphoribosyltransferase